MGFNSGFKVLIIPLLA